MLSNTYAKANTRTDLDLEDYFGKIKATCARKTIITALDLVYLCAVNLPIFVFCAYFNLSGGNTVWWSIVDSFHKLIETTTEIKAWRMVVFSVWMCFSCYLYFVFIPSKAKYQTVFSNTMGMRAITLDDNLNWKAKLDQRSLFRANLIPVFSIPMMSTVFFYFAWITNDDDWHENLIKSSLTTPEHWTHYWVYGMRMIVVVVFFLQIHHLFTVGASKKALNWFTKSNRIIYVNVERALVVASTEDRAVPNKANIEDISAPGGLQEVQLELDDRVLDLQQIKKLPIEFSSDIDMDNDLWMDNLRREEEKVKESDNEK